jgi:SPP1 gp7 family putative phage head morphogenesis protein
VKIADGNVPPTYAIERLVRTEMLKGSDRARQLLYAENSDVVQGEEIVVALDQRTCEICGPLDGKTLGSAEVDRHLESWDAMMRPPFHPNCRCTTTPQLASWKDLLGLEGAEGLEEFEDEERVIRNPLTGKSMLVPTISFEEWQRRFGGFAPVVRSRR